MKRIDTHHLKEIFENYNVSPWFSTYNEKVPDVLSSRSNLGILDQSTYSTKLRYIQYGNTHYLFELVDGYIRIIPTVPASGNLVESSEFMITYFPIRKWNEIMVNIFQPERAIICYFNESKDKYVRTEKLVSVHRAPMNEFNYNVQFTGDILITNVGLKSTLFKHYVTLKTLKIRGKGKPINKIFDESGIFNAPVNLLYKVSKLPIEIITSDNQLGFCGYTMSSRTSVVKSIKLTFNIKKEYRSEVIWLIQDCLELGEVISVTKHEITIKQTSTEYYD